MDTLVLKIGYAIAAMEGFNIPNSRARRNNNPGNLKDPGPHRIWPHIPIDADGFLIPENAGKGWDMLFHQVQLNINRGLTLYEFFAGKEHVYGGIAPSSDHNRPLQYSTFVATRLGGVSLDTPLNQLKG